MKTKLTPIAAAAVVALAGAVAVPAFAQTAAAPAAAASAAKAEEVQQVIVTGRSGDGGIDGHGVLEINPPVTFKVMFQCKKGKNSVNPTEVRDFRGAMQGRAGKASS